MVVFLLKKGQGVAAYFQLITLVCQNLDNFFGI